MAYNEKLAGRIREALVDQPNVEEKKMFKGLCFMVNGKMCLCASGDEMLCRIGPDNFEHALETNGIRGMMRNGKPLKDFVFLVFLCELHIVLQVLESPFPKDKF